MATQATPGVSFKAGQSHQQLGEMLGDLTSLRDMLRQITAAARETNGALAGMKVPAGARPRQQRQPTDADARNIFASMVPGAGASEADWKAAGKKMAEAREKALMDGLDLNRTERQTFSRVRSVAGSIAGRERAGAMQGPLGRLVNFAGWSPFMPQNMYLAQMALGEMGLGLGLPFVAAGMGALGVGTGALALNAALVSQSRTGEQMAATLGTTPTFTTGAEVAKQLAQLGGALHLTGEQPSQVAGGLAAGGVGRANALGDAFAQAANLVNVFGLTIDQATRLVGQQYTDLGRSTQEVTGLLAGMAQAALTSGVPAGNIAAVLAGSPDLLANVGANQAGQAAAMFAGVFGSTQLATTMANIANVHGVGAASLAAQLGMSLPALDQLRSTDAGQGQVVDKLDAIARQMDQQLGPEVGFSAFNARMGPLGGTLTWDEWLKAIGAAPNAGVLAASKPPILGPPVPQAAQAGLAATAAGQLALGSQLAQPFNVKDMTVNAAQVALAVTGNVLQSGAAALAPGTPNGALATIAAQGGPQGLAANLRLASQGNMPALGAALEQMATAGLAALVGAVNPTALPAAQAATEAIGRLTGQAPATPPGGGGGGVTTLHLNLSVNGQRVQAIPVALTPGGNQQAQQYIPTTERGVQYR